MFDEAANEFVTRGDVVLELEHSLVSLSKWESTFEKPFLTAKEKTPEEILEYIKAMVLTPEVSDNVFERLSQENLESINTYIEAKHSGTSFPDVGGRKAPMVQEIATSELIYYWMTVFNIPFTCENWNLNRLFTLIRICNAKQEKPQKMSKSAIAARNRELNAQRKAQLGTKG